MKAESVSAWGESQFALQARSHFGTCSEMDKHKYRMRKQVMEEICELQTSPGEMDRLQDLLGLDIPRGVQPVCMAVKLDCCDNPITALKLPNLQINKYQLMNLIEETISHNGAGGFCSEMGMNRFAVVHYWHRLHSRRQMEEQSGSLAFELSAVMKQHLNRTVSIGLSDVKASMNRVADAWTEANERLAVAFYSGSGSVIIPPVSRPAEPEQPIRLESYFDSLYAAIQHSDRNEADRLLAEIERCARRHRIAPTALFELYAWLVAKLNRASDGQLGSVIRDDIDFRQFIAGLQAVCEATWSGGQMIIREREEIRKSLEYIESHYSKAIYLEDIARHVNLNPAYLSTLFNRELKMGLSEYINRKRIKLAAELLNKRFYSNIELADAVGIHNERYFCTLFKKYTGTTPQKYRCNLKPY